MVVVGATGNKSKSMNAFFKSTFSNKEFAL